MCYSSIGPSGPRRIQVYTYKIMESYHFSKLGSNLNFYSVKNVRIVSYCILSTLPSSIHTFIIKTSTIRWSRTTFRCSLDTIDTPDFPCQNKPGNIGLWTRLAVEVIVWIRSERAIRRKRTEILLPLACDVTTVSPDTVKRIMIYENPPSSLTIFGDWSRGTVAILEVTRGLKGQQQ